MQHDFEVFCLPRFDLLGRSREAFGVEIECSVDDVQPFVQ